jgi:FMN phosphatase YigB (HAD superfamily)
MEINRIEVVFFDIGGTLGELDPATGQLVPYQSSIQLLDSLRNETPLRIGVITTLGPTLSSNQGRQLLKDAGLWPYLDDRGFISDHEAGRRKPDRMIYEYAAQEMGAPIQRCLYVGEHLLEVLGAEAAGMRGCLKPRSKIE